MSLTILSPPAQEPVSLQEAKDHLRITHTDEDAVIGALIAAGPIDMNISKIFGFLAVVLASVNIFGGFVVTNRMLSMFKKKERKG